MKKLIILGAILLLVFNFLSGTVLAEDELAAEFKRIDDLYEKMDEDSPEKKLDLMVQIIEMCDKLVKKYPDNPEVYWKAAASYSNYAYFGIENSLEVLEKGKKYVEKSIELAPGEGRGYFWLGTFLGQIGQEKGIFQSVASIRPMRDNLEKSIELEPDFAPAYDIIARLYLQAPGWPISIGNKDKALAYRIKSVELAPEKLNYQWSLYENYLEVKNMEMAKKVLIKIIDMTENSTEIEAKEYNLKAKKALNMYDW